MLKSLKLTRYKGFKTFTVYFGDRSLLLGPNNAGKSTIVNALRLAGAASRHAMRVRASDVFRDLDRSVFGHPLRVIHDAGYDFDNISHEFESSESRLDLTLRNGSKLHMVWPEDEPAFFWVEDNGQTVTTAAVAKEVLTRIGIVPTLTPVERQESSLSREYLAKNVETKLASRHFRNNLRAVQLESRDDYAELLGFMLANTPEVSSLEIETSYRDGTPFLDLYYRHPESRVRKELVWAGDGLQIWLQLLFHLWRTRGLKTVLLDEPDVFLHPDLQRRMVRVVEASARQIVLASHAAEVASEATTSSLVWVDRKRKSSRAITEDTDLEQFSTFLGSAFNLSIARALRSKVALFVEGDDMKILRVLARKVGASGFAAEQGLAIVPIGGFSHWPSVEAFGWLKSGFLGRGVKVRVLLDRDYRSANESDALEERLLRSEVAGHVWKRKELESYLLEPTVVARVAGVTVEAAGALLGEVLEMKKSDVLGPFLKQALSTKPAGDDVGSFMATQSAAFEVAWTGLSEKLAIAPAKSVIAGWNAMARERGARMISASKLADAFRAEEVVPEMKDFLLDVESDL